MAWVPELPGTEGLEVLDDGTMRFSGLRAQGRTYRVVYNDDDPRFIDDIIPFKIRITAAVPLDHRITYGYKLSGNPTGLPTGQKMSNDADVIEQGVRRQYYAQAGKLYQRWLRRNSWPTPESVLLPNGDPTPKAEDKLGGRGFVLESVRDDIVSLQAHANRVLAHVGRVQGNGSTLNLKGLCVSYDPGDGIQELTSPNGAVSVGKCIREIVLHCGLETQRTDLVLS